MAAPPGRGAWRVARWISGVAGGAAGPTPDVLRLLARIYQRLDRTDDAAKTLKKLGKLDSTHGRGIRPETLAAIRAGRTECDVDGGAAVNPNAGEANAPPKRLLPSLAGRTHYR